MTHTHIDFTPVTAARLLIDYFENALSHMVWDAAYALRAAAEAATDTAARYDYETEPCPHQSSAEEALAAAREVALTAAKDALQVQVVPKTWGLFDRRPQDAKRLLEYWGGVPAHVAGALADFEETCKVRSLSVKEAAYKVRLYREVLARAMAQEVAA